MFFHFLINFLFLKILIKRAKKKKKKKKHFLAKISVFWAKSAKIFKNKINPKCEKTFPRYMYFRWLWQILGDLCPKIFFLPLLKKKFGAKESFSWRFLKNTIFSQKSDYLNRFLVKFPF